MNIALSPLFEKQQQQFSTFLVYCAIALTLFSVDSHMNYLRELRNVFKNFLLPTQLSILYTTDTVSQYVDQMYSWLSLGDKIKTLEEERLQLIKRLNNLEGLHKENKQLRALHGIRQHTEQEVVTAEVISHQFSVVSQKVLLNKGQTDGIRLGIPVITSQGLFGQVSRAYKHYSEVALLTHPRQSVPVKIQGTNITGVLYGMGKPTLEFRYFPQQYTVKLGDILITSGLSELFDSDIMVAKIVRLETTSTSDVRAIALPIVAFDQQRFVAISTKDQDYENWLESIIKKGPQKQMLSTSAP